MATKEQIKRYIAKLRGERDDLAGYGAELEEKLKAAPKAEDFAALQAKLRGVTHRTAFEKLAAKAGVKPDAVGDLYSLLGLTADADEPDEKAIAKALEKGLESRPWAKAETKAETTETTKEAPKKLAPGEGANRGQSGSAPGTLTVARSDIGDPEYMRIHGAAIAAAGSALQIV